MFGICISIGVRQLKFISLSLFECSFQVSFFSRFSNSGSSHTEPRSLSKQCMQRQCPEKTERHIFRSQTHRRIYKFFRRGEGGGLLQPLLTYFSVRKAGLGATPQKMAKKLPFSGNVSDQGQGGGEPPPPPSKTANETCDECLCGKFSPPSSTIMIFLPDW